MSLDRNSKVEEVKKLQYCKWCESYFLGSERFHINEKNHKNNLRFMDWKSQPDFIEPFIIAGFSYSRDPRYFCLICDYFMKKRQSYVRRHLSSQKHSDNMKNHGSKIFPVQDKKFYCATCDFVIMGSWEICLHLIDPNHMFLPSMGSRNGNNIESKMSLYARWKSFVHPFIKEQSDQEFYCISCDASLWGQEILWNHVRSKNHIFASQISGPHLIPLEDNSFLCLICDFIIPDAVDVCSHLKGRSHLNNIVLEPIDWFPRKDFPAPFIHRAADNNFYCIVCDRPISGVIALESHKNGADHMSILEREIPHIAPLYNELFICTLCECVIRYYSEVSLHLAGIQHLKKLGVNNTRIIEIKNRPKIAKWSSIKNAIEPFIVIKNHELYCILCNCSYIGKKALDFHTLSASHKVFVAQQTDFIHPLDNFSFYCSLCDQLISDSCQVNFHIRATKHQSFRSVVTRQQNIKYDQSDAENQDEVTNEKIGSVQNHEIQSENHFSKSTTTLSSQKDKKRLDSSTKNEIAPQLQPKIETAAKNLKEFDERLLNFQKRNYDDSGNFDKNSQPNDAAKSIDFGDIGPITGKMQSLQELETKLIGCSRNIGSFEKPKLKETTGLQKNPGEIKSHGQNSNLLESSGKSSTWRIENLTERTGLLLEDTMSPTDLDANESSENDETLIEDPPNKKNFSLIDPKAANTKKKKDSSESIDSGTENWSPMTSTSSISFENLSGKKQAKKTYLKRVARLLDFEEDIYDMRERLTRVKLGLDLRFVIDSTRSYCLVCRKIISSKYEMDNYLVHLYDLEHLQFLDEMQKNNEELLQTPKSCNNELALALEFIEIVSNDCARCLVCQIEIDNNYCILLQHIEDKKHQKAREEMRAKAEDENEIIASQIYCDWYKVQKYECVTCSKKFDAEIDFVEHLLDDEEHQNQLKTIDNDCTKIIYEFCALCALIYCASSSAKTNHHSSSSHKWFVRNGPFVVEELPRSTKKLLVSLINNETYETIDVMQEIEDDCKSSIIRAYDKRTGHDYNSTFRTEPPVQDIQFIKFFNKTCPSIVHMISFLKEWLVRCDLFGARQISTVALYWYVILYLQAISKLPSITTLNAMKMFCRGLGDSENDLDTEEQRRFILREHLVGFFSLYANFDYRYDVACPLLGKVIEKRAFADNVYCLPEELKSYMSYMSNTEFAEPFRIDSVMCLQDPFDLQNNLTKSVSKFDLSRFRIFCSKSYSLLCSFEP